MKRILFIVDEPNTWEFMSFYLAMQACKVYRSNSIEEVFSLTLTSSPDLVVIDNTSGKTDLQKVYPRFGKEPSLDKTRALILTNPAEHELVSDVQRKQDIFITRPLRPKMLLIIIRSIVYNEKLNWIRLVKDARAL
jgi:DNA-binding response OmpR family regulator